MAQRKPLVLNSGQIEQLQAGDYISDESLPTFTNNNAGALVIGAPVYMVANDAVDKAKADAVGTVNVIGLMTPTSTAAAATGAVLLEGVLSATTGQWDAVTGGSGGLVKDTIYYLDPAAAGMLTSTAPSTAGQFVVQIGIGLSTTEIKVSLQRRVKL